MREISVPRVIELEPADDLTDIVFARAAADPSDVALLRRDAAGAWQPVTSSVFLAEIMGMAKGLIAAGIKPGDHVALLSRTRYEWTLTDFALWCAGAVTVPVYETSSVEQVRWMLSDSKAVACLVETATHAELVEGLRAELPSLELVWQFDAGAVEALTAEGAHVSDEDIAARRAALTGDTVATLIYTSGTTGRPKGCELTHRNLRAEVDTAVQHVSEVFTQPGATALLFLPLAHVLARVVSLMCIRGGILIAHAPDIKELVRDLSEVKPTFVLGVPRVFEKVYNGAEQKAETAGKGRIFRAAAATAVSYSQAQDTGGPGLVLKAKYAVFDKLVFGKLRAVLGGRVTFAVSGGAPLGERLGHFYRGIGLHILEGYGLTETTAAAHVNTPTATRIGTVGRPMPGMTVRIADDGEVRFRGDMVFRGYHGNPDETANMFDADGFLKTGDIGEIDADGYLRITGRAKEILVTSGGKNVAPAILEDALRAHPLVSQCLAVGDGQPYIACLVTLDAEALKPWLEQRGRTAAPIGELVEDPDVLAAVQAAVDDANRNVSTAESIRKFRILAVDFTEAGGQLTPTFKVKRAVVMKEFAADVAALYAGKRD